MSGDIEAVRRALSEGIDEVHFQVEAAVKQHGTGTTDGKRKILMTLLPRMQNLDPTDDGAKELRRLACDALDMEPARLVEWIASKAKRKTLSDTQMVGMSVSRGEEDHELALLRQILVNPGLLAKLDGQTPWRNQTVGKVMLAAQGASSPEAILDLFRGQPEEGLLIRLLFEGRDPGTLSRAGNERYEQKIQSYAAAATDDIVVGLNIDSLRGEVDLLKTRIGAAGPAEQMAMLRQISELQRAIEAEKRTRRNN